MSGLEAEKKERRKKLKLSIYSMWNEGIYDTDEIAYLIGVPESEVYNIIAELTNERRSSK